MRSSTILPLLIWLSIAIPGITIGQQTDSLTVARMGKLAREVQDETAAFTAKMNQETGKLLEAIKQHFIAVVFGKEVFPLLEKKNFLQKIW